MENYFSLFSLTPSFDIDTAALEKKYFELQRLFHPDRMVGKSAPERTQAISQSMQANEAYEALKSPLTRARHLLELNGIHVGGEQDSVKPSHALLMEIMESREALAEVVNAADVQKLEVENAAEKVALDAQLSATFAAQEWKRAAELTIKLGYLVKMDDEIRVKKKAFGA